MNKNRFLQNLEEQERQYKINQMVTAIEKKFPLSSEVKEALLSIDREYFMPKAFKHFAYSLDALPITGNQYISSPLTVAKMTQFLEPSNNLTVLEIGCGSGYQAAILSQLFKRVFTIERIEALLNEAKIRFRELGLKNILTKFEDGTKGWEAFAPFDRILFSASPKEIPQTLFDQLKEGGILLAPVNHDGLQMLTRFYKKNGMISSEVIEQSHFVPVLSGKE